jgi:carboxyl-terminal processing protease
MKTNHRERDGLRLTASVLCLALAFFARAGVGATEPPSGVVNSSAYAEMDRLTEVLIHVRKHHVEEKTYREIVNGAIQGMLQSMDPHSAYLDPDAYRDMVDDTTGRYGGIGIEIGEKDGYLTVVAPKEDSPAFKAGLQSSDRIVEIDGENAVRMPLENAVKKLRGPKDTKVRLKIRRPGEEEERAFEIVRDDIEIASVKGTRIIGDDIGYIRITQFSLPTAEAVRQAVEELSGKGMKALVLDLRSNPGGLFRSAVNVAEKFLREGDVVVAMKGRVGVMEEIASKAGGDYHRLDLPLAVLVNGGTASAAEIVAGALQDHKRAVVIGETTFGKASVQSVIRTKSDPEAAIRLTTARYHTPSGKQIHQKGIEPDIRVPVSRQEWVRILRARPYVEDPERYAREDRQAHEKVVDPPLQRAVDLLQAMRILSGR